MKCNYLKKNNQFIRFGLVGLSNTLIAYLTYVFLVYISVHYQIANVAAFVTSSFSGFFFNRLWVFKVGESSLFKQLSKYYVVYIFSLVVSMTLTFVWIEYLDVNVYLPPILNLILTVPCNFLLNKYWAFRTVSIKK